MAEPTCIDCIAEGVPTARAIDSRSGPRSPRCATHYRATVKRRKQQARGKRLVKTYGITTEEYAQILEFQGGVCAVCGIANGTRKALAVDHDHETGQVRALVCGRDNFELLGRYDIPALERAIRILRGEYPAEQALGRKVYVPKEDS